MADFASASLNAPYDRDALSSADAFIVRGPHAISIDGERPAVVETVSVEDPATEREIARIASGGEADRTRAETDEVAPERPAPRSTSAKSLPDPLADAVRRRRPH